MWKRCTKKNYNFLCLYRLLELFAGELLEEGRFVSDEAELVGLSLPWEEEVV